MTEREHRHRSVQGWALLFEGADGEETAFAACPRAREAWEEGVEPWLRHAVACPACRDIARAQEIFAGEHLDCPACRSNLEVVYRLVDESEHYEPGVVLEMMRAEPFLEGLAELPLEEQMECALTEPFYQQWGFVQRLLADARAHWHRGPEVALDRALVAVVACGKLLPESYGERWIADLQAKAHAYTANAHRILGRFARAEQEFAKAEECLARGVCSGQAEARVFGLKVSLLKDQHKNKEALALLGELERFYAEHGERHEMGRLALQRGIVLDSLGCHLQAAEECERAATLLESARDPSLPLVARNNAIEHLLCAGHVERARALFDELPVLPEPLDELERRWVEAHLLCREERYGEAREVYEHVHAGFAEARAHYKAALATLDLAMTVHLEGGHHLEVRRLAEEATVQLTLAGARSQAFAAQRLLLHAVRDDVLSRALLERVRQRLATLQPS